MQIKSIWTYLRDACIFYPYNAAASTKTVLGTGGSDEEAWIETRHSQLETDRRQFACTSQSQLVQK